MRLVTIRELVIEELNQQLADEGRDVRVMTERPRPQLAVSEGVVVSLFGRARDGQEQDC
jgi:hypothetical protein